MFEEVRKLIAEQISIYRKTNVVRSEKFSEIIQAIINLIDENKIDIQENTLIFKRENEEKSILELKNSFISIKNINKKINLIIIVSVSLLIGLVVMISLILSNEIEKKIKVMENSKIKERRYNKLWKRIRKFSWWAFGKSWLF